MYEILIKDLRENHDKYFARDMEAADAIEELQKALKAVNDAHNEGYDVGYWAGRRDYEPKWIPVEERLPLYGQDVLVVRTYRDGEKCQEVLMAHIAVWNEETGKKWWNATNITHWMPLPMPPKTPIRECIAVAEAQASQQDIFSYSPRSNATEDYKALVEEIIKGDVQ